MPPTSPESPAKAPEAPATPEKPAATATAVGNVQKDVSEKVKKVTTIPGVSSNPDLANSATGTIAEAKVPTTATVAREQPLIPTPSWLQHKTGPALPDQKTLVHGIATAAVLFQPTAIPAVLAAWGAMKVAGVARKWFPPYRWAENAVKAVASAPLKGLGSLGKSIYGIVGKPVNRLLNVPRALGGGVLGVTNRVMDIPRDILQYVESHVLRTGEAPVAGNKIDAPAVGIIGLVKQLGGGLKNFAVNNPKTSILAGLILWGAFQTGGLSGIGALISTVGQNLSKAFTDFTSYLASSATNAAVSPAGPAATPASSPGFVSNAAYWLWRKLNGLP